MTEGANASGACLRSVWQTLGKADPAVQDRLDLLAVENDPVTRAKALRRRIASFGGGRGFVSYGQSFDLARQLRHIAATIRERVLPHEPDRAFELADAFLRSDATVFESMDDSSGTVGDVFRDVCRLWLEAAARCRAKRDWIGVFKEAVARNDYGARDELVPNAALLFPEAELRAMLAEYLAVAREPRPEGARLDSKGFTASVVASQLAIALRDPKLYEEATRVRSGALNSTICNGWTLPRGISTSEILRPRSNTS